MGEEPVDPGDFAADRDVLAEHLDRSGAGGECLAAGTGGLVADEQDGVAVVRCQSFEVMEHPSAGQHPAGREQDHRAFQRRETL